MPRQARIDAPGALQHIVIRGIERKSIFKDGRDRDNFLGRLGIILPETSTPCYAWALLRNHVHLLLRTGLVPIATVMRRLLTGYAQQFNRRHRRHGQLFQNRYKSFLCEEDPYLLELVRYIHLNPIRAGVVEGLKELRSYSYCGHSVLMGKYENAWQDTDYVLGFFGRTLREARKSYEEFVSKGISLGRRPELVGGGLIRSVGGWLLIRDYRRGGDRIKADERILGSSSFVERVLQKANEDYGRKIRLRAKGPDLVTLIGRVAAYYQIDPEDLKSPSKERRVSLARTVLCYVAVRELMLSCADVARALNIDPSAVSKAAKRGQAVLNRDRIQKDLLMV
jgi:putative transposase